MSVTDSRALLPSMSSAGHPPFPRLQRDPLQRSPCLVRPCRNRGPVGLRTGRWGSLLLRRGEGTAALVSHNEQDVTKEWIHFVGVGGAGLSALAMLALEQGFEVSGSDITWNGYMDNLHKAGARLFVGHSISNMQKKSGLGLPDALVISSAVPADNREIVHAMSVGIPVYKRDLWLKRITGKYNLIAVSGTHGKSTTAAMLSYVMHAMGDSLIAVIGANVPQFSGSIIPGKGPNFVLEADEYDGCFLGLSPDIAVVTNVELDHVDIFQDEEAVLNIFRKFVRQIKTGGTLILCGDSVGARALFCEPITNNYGLHGRAVTTYGLSAENDWSASSIGPNSLGGQDYVLCYKKCQITRITLQLPGVHNVLNSLAVIATAVKLMNTKSSIHGTIHSLRNHLSDFKGVSRRFELIGEVDGCKIYDDYAHHPTEVRAVLQAAREKFVKQAIWVVFQPHTFSRLSAFMEDYSTAFANADHVVITKVYGARERYIWNYSGEDLANKIIGTSAEYIHELKDVIEKLALAITSDDQETIVIALGAGDVTALGPELLRRLQGVKRI